MRDAAWLLALGSAGFFGLALVLTQFGLRHLPPLSGAVVSIPTSALLFWAASPWLLDAAGWRFGAVGLSNGLAVMTMYAALSRGSVTLVSPLVATYPLVTLALSGLLLRAARLSMKLCLDVAVTVAGVALLLAG